MHPDKKAVRKEKIVAAAREVFSRFGYRKTSLVDVATTAGISKATLYQYFDGKDALFGTVVTRHYESYVARLQKALGEEDSLVSKLRRYALVMLETHRETSDSIDSLEELMEQFPFVVKHIMRVRQLELDVIETMLAEAIELGQVRSSISVSSVSAMLFAVFRGMIGAVCSASSEDAPIIDDFLDVLLHGLLRKDPGEESK
jgi:AcrR family transcriptional regulator